MAHLGPPIEKTGTRLTPITRFYGKFPEGTTKIRVLSDTTCKQQLFTAVAKFPCIADSKEEIAALNLAPAISKYGPSQIRQALYFVYYDYTDKTVKLMASSKATLNDALERLWMNEATSDLKTFDIAITGSVVENNGLYTLKYGATQASEIGPIPQEIASAASVYGDVNAYIQDNRLVNINQFFEFKDSALTGLPTAPQPAPVQYGQPNQAQPTYPTPTPNHYQATPKPAPQVAPQPVQQAVPQQGNIDPRFYGQQAPVDTWGPDDSQDIPEEVDENSIPF